MASFEVILEDVSTRHASGVGGLQTVISNRRTQMIEADSLVQAWQLARAKFYFHRISGEIQIVDVVPT
jgi:hypothetical protein